MEARCIPITRRPARVLRLDIQLVSLEMQAVSLLVLTGRLGSREYVSLLVLSVSPCGPVGRSRGQPAGGAFALPAKVQRQEVPLVSSNFTPRV